MPKLASVNMKYSSNTSLAQKQPVESRTLLRRIRNPTRSLAIGLQVRHLRNHPLWQTPAADGADVPRAIRHPFFGNLQNAPETRLRGRADTRWSFWPEIASATQGIWHWSGGLLKRRGAGVLSAPSARYPVCQTISSSHNNTPANYCELENIWSGSRSMASAMIVVYTAAPKRRSLPGSAAV